MLELSQADLFGRVSPPAALGRFGTVESGAIGLFLNLIFRTLIVVAAIWALLNLILAGYAFMSAGDDPKKVGAAWTKIWQTLLGLAAAAGAFVLAAIFGQLLFGNASFILNPTIPQP